MEYSNNSSDFKLKDFVASTHMQREAVLARKIVKEISYSWEQLDQSLFCISNFEDLSLYHHGKVPEHEYIETYFNFGTYRKRIIPHKFNGYIQNGASLVVNKSQHKCIAINSICNTFAKFTNCVVNANSYAARGGSGTFNLHWDTHDVYAVQLIGRKRWKVFPPSVVDPLPNQKSKDYADKPTHPIIDIILEAGDVLYIPRGYWHDAVPIEEQETFHIAIGVYPNTVIDYLSWIIANKMVGYSGARDYINNHAQPGLSDALMRFKEMSTSEDVLREFFDEHIKHVRYKTKINTATAFSNSYSPADLTFNGIYKNREKDRYIINGVQFESCIGDDNSSEDIPPEEINIESMAASTVRDLINFGILS